MRATPPPANRLWHPSQGISFSPGPTRPASPMAESPGAVSRYHVATEQSTDVEGEEAWAAAVGQPLATPILSLQNLAENGVESALPKPAEEPSLEAGVVERKATDDPPPPVFEYRMDHDLFYEAKKSPPGSHGSYWSYTQYRRVAEDGSSQKVKVHYCRSRYTMEKVCREYFLGEKVLGFDLEWMADSTKRDGLRKNVSLIQLASPSRIGLFHVALFAQSDDMVGPTFRSIMEDPGVTKVGVFIKGDTTRMRNFLDIHSRGLMELSNLYKLVTYCRNGQYHSINRRLVPLATQVEEYLHLPLFKGQDVRSSDWSRRLGWEQVIYAASDAYAGLQLYATLDYHRKQLDPCPPRPHHAELNLAIPLPDGVKLASLANTSGVDDEAPTDKSTARSSELCLTAVGDLSVIEDQETVLSVEPVERAKKDLIRRAKPTPATLIPKALERPKDSRVEVAEDRVASYQAAHPQSRSSFPQLRSYYLWHCYDLPPATIAQLLRDPPLQTTTIVHYILSTVQTESMPVDLDRLRELAGLVPQSTLWVRWPVVGKMIASSEA
ncbi:ribonuclease H-like protein [Xylaria palmicola]|nr:ribonuclease H-like protein [Xylaria palmicola]